MFKWLDQRWPNWPVAFGALVTAVSIAVYDASVNGTLHKSTFGAIVGIAIVGFIAKRKSVTGGSVPQTVEAATRAEPVAPKAAAAAEKFNATVPASKSGVPRYPGSQPR